MTESGIPADDTVTVKTNTDPGSITIRNQESAQTIEVTPTPWTQEEAEHYRNTGETPLARLHRENLTAQWSADA